MGKLGGFLQIERHGIPERDPLERAHDYREFLLTRPVGELREQGARCMDCGVPFCHNGCPLGNLIPDWNDLVYRDRWEEAIAQLHATNNFPEFTGRLCPAPCEAACVLEIREGDAVTIKQIEHAIINRACEEGWVTPRPPRRETGQAVAVVGSGPGGHGRRPAAAPGRPPRDAVRARRGGRRARALRRARLQDREDGRPAARRAADRRGRRAALRRGRRPRRRPSRSCAGASTRSCSRPARACRATCRCPAASSTACTSRWTTSTSATAGSRASSAPTPTVAQPAAVAREITATGKDVVVIGGGDTGADCVGNALREGARSIVQLELLPEPPPQRPDDRTPWPQWPLKYRLSYAMEEAQKSRRRRAGLLGRDDPASPTTAAARSRRCTSPRPSPRRRSSRCPAPSASCRPSSCCWRWASWAPSRRCSTSSAWSRRARQRQGGQAVHDLGRGRVRRRRRPPRPVADRVGDQRGPPVRARWSIATWRRGSTARARRDAIAQDDGLGRPRRRRRRPRGTAAARRAGASQAGSRRHRLIAPHGRASTADVPTFCRHNRFIERCPICSQTLARHPRRPAVTAEPQARAAPARRCPRRRAVTRGSAAGARGRRCASTARSRAADDGYRSELLPGVHASADASAGGGDRVRSGRLLALAAAPPGLYAEVARSRPSDLEQATWICFLIAYFCPLEGEDPFAGIRVALARPAARLTDTTQIAGRARGIPLGPRTSHEPGRGSSTLRRLPQLGRAGGLPGSWRSAGDPGWSAERRFERLFERLALPGFRARGALSTCSSRWDASACMSCEPTRCTSPARAGRPPDDPTHRWPPSACSRSAIRCCSSAARRRCRARSRSRRDARPGARQLGRGAAGDDGSSRADASDSGALARAREAAGLWGRSDAKSAVHTAAYSLS